MGMALEGGEVNAGNVVYYLPVGLYSTTTEAVEMGGSCTTTPPPGTSRFSFPAPQRTGVL